MKTYELKHGDVVRTLKELADERPEYIYEPEKEIGEDGYEVDHYRYAHKDGPGCIVGHVVARLLPDFPLANLDIDPFDSDDPAQDSGTPAEKSIPRQGIKAEWQTLNLLRDVQRRQDAEWAWGRAVGESLPE